MIWLIIHSYWLTLQKNITLHNIIMSKSSAMRVKYFRNKIEINIIAECVFIHFNSAKLQTTDNFKWLNANAGTYRRILLLNSWNILMKIIIWKAKKMHRSCYKIRVDFLIWTTAENFQFEHNVLNNRHSSGYRRSLCQYFIRFWKVHLQHRYSVQHIAIFTD